MRRPAAQDKDGPTNRPAGRGDVGMAERVTDHLANERTALAWVRTALGLIGLGFVLARMGLFLRQLALSTTTAGPAVAAVSRGFHAGREFLATGVVFLLLGTAFGALSCWLYDRNRRAIDAGRFEPTAWAVVALSVVVVVGGLVVTGLVLWRVAARESG